MNKKEKNQEDELIVKKWKIKSFMSLLFFVIFSCVFMLDVVVYKNSSLAGLCIIGLFISWFAFSHYHTRVAIYKIKKITDEYLISAELRKMEIRDMNSGS